MMFDGNDDILFNSKTPYYVWLSNFHPAQIPIMIQGQVLYFRCAEGAYQYAKTIPRTVESVLPWLNLDGFQAKAKSKTIAVRPGWSDCKVDVMELILTRKFSYNPSLHAKLKETGNTKLVHLSPWDLFWGVDDAGKGSNQLGKLLMKIRDEAVLIVPSWCER